MKRIFLLAFGALLVTVDVCAHVVLIPPVRATQSLWREYTAAFSLSPFGPSSRSDFSLTVPRARACRAQASEQAGTSKTPEPAKKRVLTAAGETLALDLIVWAYDQYIKKAEYSYISLETIQGNLRHGWEWDTDGFYVNFFGHPYSGSFLFNAGRSNGLNFWESALCTFGGSLVWEIAGERYAPSANDMIMATTGGLLLGEALHRFSSLVLDDSARGFNRVWREIVALMIDPVRGFNRLVHGEATRTLPAVPATRPSLHGQITWAGSAISQSASLSGTKSEPLLEIDMIYGTPFKEAPDESRKPFDYFPFEASLRFGEKKTYLTVETYGLLLGKQLRLRGSRNFLLGLFQDYDYVANEAIELGGSSFCGGGISRFELSSRVRLTAIAQFGWLLLGVSNNPYVHVGDRDYNYGTGLTAKIDAFFDLQKFGYLRLRWEHFGLAVVEGMPGVDKLDVFVGEYTLPIWKGLGLGAKYVQYRRHSLYDDVPGIKQLLYELRGSLSFRF